MCYTILSSELLFGAKMLVKKKLIKKIAIKTVSILVVISLVLTGVNDLSFAIPVPFNMVPAQARISSVNTNIIPFNVGRVTETIYNGSGKTLLLIQDLHAHRQTQENINSILKILDKKYGIKNIWLEGASGQLDTSWLSSIKDKTSKEKIIQFLLEKGRLTGAELFSIQVNRPEILKGIENREVYLTNFDRLKEIYNKKSEIESYLPKIKAILDAKTKKYFSRENRKMIVLYEKNLSEKIKVEKYFKAVLKASKKAGIDLNKYEQIAKYLYVMDKHKNLKLNKARKQTKEILVELKTLLPYQQYKSLVDKLNNKETEFEFYTDINKLAEENGLLGKYEDAKKLFEYLTYRELLNPIEFAEQEAELINEIEMRFARTGYEKEIVFLRKYFGLLESYLKNKITADEYKYFENNKERFKTTWTKYVDIDEIIDINKYFDLFDDFYKDNLERNRYFIENITGVKPAAEQDAIIIKGSDQYNIKVLEELGKEKDGIEVVIAGGFHTRGLSRLFEEEKINYIVITPNVIDETVTSERLYENMFTEEYAILKEKFANIPTTALVKEIIRRLGDIEEVRLNAKGLIELVTAKETIMLGQNGSINDNIAETSARDIKLSQEQEKIVAEAFLSLQEYLKKQRENVRKQKSGEPAEDISVLKERTEKLINNIEDNSLREEFLQAESNKTFKQPKIIGRLKNRGIENKELFNFLVKFRENKYIGLVNNGLLKGKDPIETFEQGLEGEYEQILNEEDFYITYGKAEKIYEEEMPLLRATDRAEYERISSFIGKPAIEEFKNYINNRKSATLKQWKEMLREDKYTNAERVLIARGIRQYLRKAKTSAIPVEYIETAFDKFIENFKNTQIEEAGQFNIYEQYLKCITEQITAEGNNPIVKEVSYNYNGTEIKGKWIRIKGEKSIDAEGKGDLELNKQILSAVSSEEWCTRGRGGEETVLEGHGSDFYVFIEDGQIRSTLGFVPAEDLEDLKTDPWYYGLFEQGNGQNNIVPEIYDEAVKKLQKELESGKYRDEDGYKTLQEIGYPDIINKKREKREKQKEFFEKTRDVTDYTDETIRQMFVEAFSVVITQDEYGNWNTVHEITDSMLDEMAEIDISIVEKFLKTIKNVELSASILNANYAKYVGDLNVGQDLKLGVRSLKKGVSLKAGGDVELQNLIEIGEGVSLKAGGDVDLRNLIEIGEGVTVSAGEHLILYKLTKIGKETSLSVDGKLYLVKIAEIGEGASLSAGRELHLSNIPKLGNNVNLSSGETLHLSLRKLTKEDTNKINKFKFNSLQSWTIEKIEDGVKLNVDGNLEFDLMLGELIEIGKGVSLIAGGDLTFKKVIEPGEEVNLTAGNTLHLEGLKSLPENTDNIKLSFKELEVADQELEQQLIEIRDRTNIESPGTLQSERTVELLEKFARFIGLKNPEKFRFDPFGAALGIIMETIVLFKFFDTKKSLSFEKQHKDLTTLQQVVIWVIRITTIGTAIFTLINPIGNVFVAAILTEWIMHFIYNEIVILSGNKNLVLQTEGKFRQPGIIKELKRRGIENKELFNFLVKFREDKYIGLINSLLKEKNLLEAFEQKLEVEYEQILNEEDFYITYEKAEKIYEEEMHLLRATDRAEYERIKIIEKEKAIEELKNYINNRKSTVLKQWKRMLREDKYTNAERVLIARGIRQYLRKAKTSAIPVEYIETAFDKFIENFKNTQIEDVEQFNIYEQYLKCITEQITAEGNNPIVKEVSYDYNGIEVKGKWIRIKGKKSIEAEGKGDLELNKQILSAVSSEEWCTRGRGGEETVLEGHGSDFYVFIEDGQIRSTLGFVPAEDLEDLKTDPWYYGLFEQGNGQNNIVPEIYDEAVKKLQKELESGKYRDEDGYKTLQEIGYPDIINKKREKREKQKEFFEKTRDVTDYTDETIRQMFVEAFSVVITQDEYGNWNTVHEITDSMLDEMAEIDISIVEKFLKTIKNVELSASILNANYAKYVGDLNVGQDLKLGVRYLKKGVRLKAGGDLDLGELTEIAEEVSLESNGELYLRNLTKIGNKAILKNGKDINLYLAGVTELGEGVTLKAGGELILLNIFKIGENVSLEAGTTLYLNRLTTLPKNTDNMELYFKWVSCSNNEIEKQLIEIRNRTERKPIEKSVLSAIVKNVNYWLQFKFFEKISTNLMLNIIKLFMEETNIVSIVDIDDIERIQEAEELAKNGTKVNMVLLRAKDEEFVTKKETGKVLGNENVGYYRELSTQRGNLTEYEYERTDGDFSSEEKILELLLEDIKNGNNIGKKNKNVLYVSPSLVKRSKSMLEKYIKDNTILSLSNESIKGALIKGLLNSHRNARVEVLSNMVMVPENIYGTYKLHEFKEEDIVALKDKGIQTIMFDITPAGMVGDKLNLTEKDFGVERQKENVYKAINIAKEHGMNVIIYGEGAENINIEDVTVAVFENPTDRQMQVMDYNKAIESKENLSNVIVTIARNERENIVITPEQIKRIINTGAAIAFDGEVLTEVSKESTSENGISMFEIIKAMFAETPKQKAEREEFEGIIDGREIALKELENIKKYSMEEIGIKDLYYFEEFIKNEDLGEKSLSDLYNKAQSFLENILIGRRMSLEELYKNRFSVLGKIKGFMQVIELIKLNPDIKYSDRVDNMNELMERLFEYRLLTHGSYNPKENKDTEEAILRVNKKLGGNPSVTEIMDELKKQIKDKNLTTEDKRIVLSGIIDLLLTDSSQLDIEIDNLYSMNTSQIAALLSAA